MMASSEKRNSEIVENKAQEKADFWGAVLAGAIDLKKERLGYLKGGVIAGLERTREFATGLAADNMSILWQAFDIARSIFGQPIGAFILTCYCDHCQYFPPSYCSWLLCTGVSKEITTKGSNWFCQMPLRDGVELNDVAVCSAFPNARRRKATISRRCRSLLQHHATHKRQQKHILPFEEGSRTRAIARRGMVQGMEVGFYGQSGQVQPQYKEQCTHMEVPDDIVLSGQDMGTDTHDAPAWQGAAMKEVE